MLEIRAIRLKPADALKRHTSLGLTSRGLSANYKLRHFLVRATAKIKVGSNMNFITTKKELVIALRGREQVWALKAKITIAKKDIKTIEFKEVFKDWRKWEVRLPGTGLPGRLIAGSFWTEEGWDFLYLTHPHGLRNPFVHNVLYIETKLPKYRRIILSVPKEDVKSVLKWAG
jgi:hypothetical protein